MQVLYVIATVAALDVLHDTWFYWTHRLLHWRPLYRKIHYMHHRWSWCCGGESVLGGFYFVRGKSERVLGRMRCWQGAEGCSRQPSARCAETGAHPSQRSPDAKDTPCPFLPVSPHHNQ